MATRRDRGHDWQVPFHWHGGRIPQQGRIILRRHPSRGRMIVGWGAKAALLRRQGRQAASGTPGPTVTAAPAVFDSAAAFVTAYAGAQALVARGLFEADRRTRGALVKSSSKGAR